VSEAHPLAAWAMLQELQRAMARPEPGRMTKAKGSPHSLLFAPKPYHILYRAEPTG